MSDASTPSVPSPTLEVHSTADPSTPSTFEHWDDDTVNLKQELMRGIYSNGFEQPSPIQKKAIIPFIKGKDLIAQAQSGTGKNRSVYSWSLAADQ